MKERETDSEAEVCAGTSSRFDDWGDLLWLLLQATKVLGVLALVCFVETTVIAATYRLADGLPQIMLAPIKVLEGTLFLSLPIQVAALGMAAVALVVSLPLSVGRFVYTSLFDRSMIPRNATVLLWALPGVAVLMCFAWRQIDFLRPREFAVVTVEPDKLLTQGDGDSVPESLQMPLK